MAYKPGPVPRETEDLSRYVADELERIAGELQRPEPDTIIFKDWPAVVAKPREGMLVFTDSDAISPPLGSGLLIYYGGTWRRLRDN